jgi:hypothetical protein
MGKFFTVTKEMVLDMITEINENVTAVNEITSMNVVATLQDSMSEECFWYDSDTQVTATSLAEMVTWWIAENSEPTPTEPANLLELFPVRIRTENQIAQIHHCYTIGLMMANTMHPTAEQANQAILQWIAKGDDQCLAMALAYREYVAKQYPKHIEGR